MVKIRLARYGTTKRPFYRIVASDTRNRRDGRFIEILGTYDPLNLGLPKDSKERKEKGLVSLQTDRIEHWLNNGAQMSPTVKRVLKRAGLTGQTSKQEKVA